MTTYKPQDVIDYVYNLIRSNSSTLGIKGIHKGFVTKLPTSPVLSIQSSDRSRDMVSTGIQTINSFEIIMLVYATFTNSEAARKLCNDVSDKVENLILDDYLTNRLGTLGAHYCLMENLEPGYDNLEDGLATVNRLTFIIKNKTQLYVA